MNATHHYLIMYDISDDKRLRHVVQWLQDYAWRIQKSVFVAEVSSVVMAQIRAGLEKRIDVDENSVYVFPICEDDWKKRILCGRNCDESMFGQNAVVL